VTTRRVVTTAQADIDIEDAVDHLLTVADATIADGFIDALQATTTVIADFPAIGSARFAVETGIPDLRDIAIVRHPYLVMYSDDADAVRIHRVLHTSRDIISVLLER
jgi:toxin ParE1/3/4